MKSAILASLLFLVVPRFAPAAEQPSTYAPLVAYWMIGEKPVYLDADQQKLFFDCIRRLKPRPPSASTDARRDPGLPVFNYWVIDQENMHFVPKMIRFTPDGGAEDWQLDQESMNQIKTLLAALKNSAK